jgi:Domain of unknown function (DUF1989)
MSARRGDIVANVNFFMYVPIREDGHMATAPGISKPGDYVERCDLRNRNLRAATQSRMALFYIESSNSLQGEYLILGPNKAVHS